MNNDILIILSELISQIKNMSIIKIINKVLFAQRTKINLIFIYLFIFMTLS